MPAHQPDVFGGGGLGRGEGGLGLGLGGGGRDDLVTQVPLAVIT